jgi:long-chain acyl-CoA synthetase
MGNCIASAIASRGNHDVIPHQDILQAKATTMYSAVAANQQGCDPTRETTIRRSPSTAAMDLTEIVDKYYYAGGEHHSVLSRIFEVFDAASPSKKAAALRPVISGETTHVMENGRMKPWAVTHFGSTQYKTCQEVKQDMIAFGKGLASLGLKKSDTLALFEDTRYEWLVAADGAWTQGLVLATVYTNLGEDALLYAIREADVSVMLCNANTVELVRRKCAESGVKQPLLIFTDSLGDGISSDGALSFHEVLRRGMECAPETSWELPSSPPRISLH